MSSTTRSRRAAFHAEIKATAPPEALKTLPADPLSKNVPPSIKDLLSGGASTGGGLLLTNTKYTCRTESVGLTRLQVGFGEDIPRWKKGSVINWAVRTDGFPTENHAAYSAYKLNEATVQWNSLDVGVKFKWVDKLEDAAFALGYGGDGGQTFAEAFFPNGKPLNHLVVYKLSFSPEYLDYQTNIFLHELGHVLGLRHEFAAREGAGNVLFGPENQRSVMAYAWPPNIRDSDEDTIRLFYNYTEAKYQGRPITNYEPDN